jgi:hypothetical protein
MTVEIRCSRTRGAIVCNRRGHDVCRWCDRYIYRPRRVPNGSFRRGTSIYMCWLALRLLSWTFNILVSTLSWAKASSLIPIHLLCIQLRFLSEIEWFKCIDHWFASRGTWGIDLLRFSCYSWWLPPPRRLGAAWRCGKCWWLFLATSRDLVKSLHRPGGVSLGSHNILLVSLQLLAIWYVLVTSFERLGVWPISHRTMWLRGTQRGLACRQARESRDKSSCLHFIDCD